MLLAVFNAPIEWSEVPIFMVRNSFLEVIDNESKFFLRLYSTAYVVSLIGFVVFWALEKRCLRMLKEWRDDERIWMPL